MIIEVLPVNLVLADGVGQFLGPASEGTDCQFGSDMREVVSPCASSPRGKDGCALFKRYAMSHSDAHDFVSKDQLVNEIPQFGR